MSVVEKEDTITKRRRVILKSTDIGDLITELETYRTEVPVDYTLRAIVQIEIEKTITKEEL